MSNNANSILIKDKTGQMKTVDLGVPIKDDLVFPKKDKPVVKSPAKTQDKTEASPPVEKEKIPEPIAHETAMPTFYFDLEDEQEAAKFRDKEQVKQQKRHQATLEYLIEQVIQQSNLELSDNVINRLKRVIDSRFREIRDLRETKDVLMRSRDLGGVGLDNNQAQDILKIIEKYRLKIGEKVELAQPLARPQTADQDFRKPSRPEAVKSEVKIDEELEKAKQDLLKQVKPVSTYVHPSYKKEPVSPKPIPAKKSEIPGRVIPTSQEIVKPAFKPSPAPALKKEFKKAPKVTSHVEELSGFDLESFRALAAEPRQAAAKIKNKIDLLEDESFEKKAQGIQSWHSSQVYQNYLSLGQESMRQKKSVEELIKEKQNQNQSSLSLKEFEAIADLSQELAY